jgi:soluble lytic murein transglycosylase-like protein
MRSSKKTSPVWAAATVAVIGAAALLSSQVSSGPAAASVSAAATVKAASAATLKTAAAAAPAAASAVKTVTAAAAVAATKAVAPAAIRLAAPMASAAVKFASEKALRTQIKFDTVRYGGKRIKTLDEESRLLLAQAAAHKAGLHEFGLGYEDVYGVIEAETSWIPRTGKGKNGVNSYGLAQFEPGTARGLGLKNPNDPVQAVYAAAVNMKHGAEWAQDKIAHLNLTPEQYQTKLREGVSIYYNLSVKGRNKWNGVNTAQLPIETRRHIRNVRAGAEEAQELAGKLLDT